MLTVLADNHLAYRGTLADMNDFLGVARGDSKTNGKIRAAIAQLEKEGLLHKIEEGRTFTLTLSKKAKKQSKVIKIQNQWVMIARNYSEMPNKSETVGWITLLKVWLFLIGRRNDEIITNTEIADALLISEKTVSRARVALETDIKSIIAKKKYYYGSWICKGSIINALAWLPDNPSEP